MKHLEELKEVVKRELEKFGKQGDIPYQVLTKSISSAICTKISAKSK